MKKDTPPSVVIYGRTTGSFLLNIKNMEEHISFDLLERLLEQFLHENPYGDTRELANYMYNKGFEAGTASRVNA